MANISAQVPFKAFDNNITVQLHKKSLGEVDTSEA